MMDMLGWDMLALVILNGNTFFENIPFDTLKGITTVE